MKKNERNDRKKGRTNVDDDLIIAVYDYWLEKRLKTVCINCIFLANYQYDLEAILRNVTLFLSNGH